MYQHKSHWKTKWSPGFSGRNFKGSTDLRAVIEVCSCHQGVLSESLASPMLKNLALYVCTREACPVYTSFPRVNNPVLTTGIFMPGRVQTENTDFLCSDLDIFWKSMLNSIQPNRQGVAAHWSGLGPLPLAGAFSWGERLGSPRCIIVSSAPSQNTAPLCL